jgi:hypothetical protein
VGVSFLLRFISEVAVLVIRHRLQLLPCHLFSVIEKVRLLPKKK